MPAARVGSARDNTSAAKVRVSSRINIAAALWFTTACKLIEDEVQQRFEFQRRGDRLRDIQQRRKFACASATRCFKQLKASTAP